MSLWSKFAPSARQRTQLPDPRRNEAWIPYMVESAAGVRVTMEEALRVAAVWACIDAISKGLASSSWNVFQRLKKGDWDQIHDDPLDHLLNVRPNPDMTAISMRQGLLICGLAYGNGYAEIVRDGAGRVSGLYPLFPPNMTPDRDEDDELIYRHRNESGDEVILPSRNVFHLAGPGLNGFLGDNMIARAAKTVALAMAGQTFAASYFGNNTVIPGVLEYPTSLGDEAYTRLKKQLEERHQGPSKAFRPMILEGGMTWKSNGSNARDSDLIASRKFDLEEICRWFGVPPHKIAHLDRSTFNNIEHLGLEFARDALTPWARRLDQEGTYKLFSPRTPGKFVMHDIEPLSQGDARSRAEHYQIMRRIGAYSVNDILRMEKKNTIGAEGDVRVVESAFVKLEDVGENLKPDATDPPDDDPPSGRTGAGVDPRAAVRETTQLMLASVYVRYCKKAENRRQYLLENSKLSPDEIGERMEYFRERERGRFHEELAGLSKHFARVFERDESRIFEAMRLALDDALTQSPTVAARNVLDSISGA